MLLNSALEIAEPISSCTCAGGSKAVEKVELLLLLLSKLLNQLVVHCSCCSSIGLHVEQARIEAANAGKGSQVVGQLAHEPTGERSGRVMESLFSVELKLIGSRSNQYFGIDIGLVIAGC